jgi:glyoxylase-like metal-dependent hydrolase (beta-lactamase superfamily II)
MNLPVPHTGRVADVTERTPEGVVLVRAPNAGPMTLSGTNTWLVGTPAWVVDPGPAGDGHPERVWAAAAARGGVAGIVLTHNHLDHSESVPALRERSGAVVAAGAAPRRARFEEPALSGLEPDVVLSDGDELGPFRVFATPGHAADHVSLLAGGVLFCGDTVLGEGSVFIPPGGGSLSAYLDSLRVLQQLELEAICPGHGPVVWEPAAKLREYLEHRLDRERRLVAALGGGLRTTAALLDDVWDDAPPALRPAAALTLESHLEKLEQEGRLPDGVERLAG